MNPILDTRSRAGGDERSPVTLKSNCTINNRNCTWTFKAGMLINYANPTLALNAWGGAKNGVALVLTSLCDSGNPNDTWTYQKGRFLSYGYRTVAIVGQDGGGDGRAAVISNAWSASDYSSAWSLIFLLTLPGFWGLITVRETGLKSQSLRDVESQELWILAFGLLVVCIPELKTERLRISVRGYSSRVSVRWGYSNYG